ncbi:transcription antitermination protein NusB [Alloprevotella sp. OH1205_COT-284]|uniref:transcription antitermination protein NusB n=1 Tax=Alloprevotella sp. OH1205_COT-284 TaxID=2491043 RepID=UPI000F5E1B96|nr:transcription antitermination protein NusB [Alloprevotella sp. OH1205_COT-284]RRD80096.1 transcription antitermination protein NusB [Alloprevotella sp. OH1205_COT-284]
MINRALIRLKVVQLVYAYYQNEGKTTEVALKELDFSLQKAYDLYRSLLLLLVELRRLAERKENARIAKNKRLGGAGTASSDKVFAENKFLLQLEANTALGEFAEKQKKSWAEEDVFLKKIYDAFFNEELFHHYIDKGEYNYESDREIIRKLYKTFIVNNPDFDALLEEQSLYWNDDKEIVDSFVLKTIKRFDEANGADQELLPAYAADEDQEFAGRLFTNTLERAAEVRRLISDNTKNWEFSRLAFMDVIIMQIALAEILTFKSIPLSVSFNEYLDIAKIYSTPRSSGYIHGMLDNIVKKLKADGVILK